MTDPLLYTKRYSAEQMVWNPSINQDRYMEGYEKCNTLLNTSIGVANEVARIAISEAIESIQKAGLFKQKVKQLCKETFARQEHYESQHNKNFADRLKLWLDYLDGTEEVYYMHIFHIYMAIKQILDKHKQSNSVVKAKVECARLCAEIAVGQYDALMVDLKKEYGVDYSQLFIAGRYTGPLCTWLKLCDIIVKSDKGSGTIDMRKDDNLRLAVDILIKKLNNPDELNLVGKYAIENNLDVARKYATEEELKGILNVKEE